MIFYCTKLNLSKCNGSLVVSIKQNMNFKYQPPYTFLCFFNTKNVLIESVSSYEDISTKKSWFHVE
jgi:hypothetical protein